MSGLPPYRLTSGYHQRRVHPLPDLWDLIRIGLEGGWTQRDRRPAADIPVQHGPLPTLGEGQSAVTWLGHSSVLLQAGSRTVLVDPVLSESIPGLIRPLRRLTPPGLAIEDLPLVDVVLLTHDHVDHFDKPTLTLLAARNPRLKVMVPRGLGRRWLRRLPVRVVELDWWQHTRAGELTLTCLPAAHWSGRTPWGLYRSLWASWMITDPSGRRVYHGGDSARGSHFLQIGACFPGIDLALLSVGAYAPRWFQASAHMDPRQAVQACLQLGAARMLPVHWGTFVLSREPITEPPRLTRHWWQRHGLAAERLWTLGIGESRLLPARDHAGLKPGSRRPAAAPITETILD
ncbi:MBL fold metallo-hydrolase [Nonomuraea sp. NPDC050536]|uniref:MBL fold metallo-hydrolase n=1 Tax=Nonomuraea sp. NPDC050536 TaxID=3364366 RepID=UPI0037C9E6A6